MSANSSATDRALPLRIGEGRLGAVLLDDLEVGLLDQGRGQAADIGIVLDHERDASRVVVGIGHDGLLRSVGLEAAGPEPLDNDGQMLRNRLAKELGVHTTQRTADLGQELGVGRPRVEPTV